MILTYQLDQNDYLQHQLFVASNTERIKKQRTKSWIIVSGVMFLLSFMFYRSSNLILCYYFLAVGIICLIFYPLYQRGYYKRHYAKFIGDTYKNRFGKAVTINFTDSAIEVDDVTSTSKVDLAELEKVTETKDYFYPRLKTGEHLIIPKSKIASVLQLRTNLKQLCNKLDINFIENLDWKWK